MAASRGTQAACTINARVIALAARTRDFGTVGRAYRWLAGCVAGVEVIQVTVIAKLLSISKAISAEGQNAVVASPWRGNSIITLFACKAVHNTVAAEAAPGVAESAGEARNLTARWIAGFNIRLCHVVATVGAVRCTASNIGPVEQTCHAVLWLEHIVKTEGVWVVASAASTIWIGCHLTTAVGVMRSVVT